MILHHLSTLGVRWRPRPATSPQFLFMCLHPQYYMKTTSYKEAWILFFFRYLRHWLCSCCFFLRNVILCYFLHKTIIISSLIYKFIYKRTMPKGINLTYWHLPDMTDYLFSKFIVLLKHQTRRQRSTLMEARCGIWPLFSPTQIIILF